ncbi:protocadherin-23 isoform X2 [Heterocephalus glaber]|uniref:Protocadherin-23 isoform X2 n=1 Tax=Heterocephalus glaber TaxID=10181 RepID=A0AAX6S4W5_HETGA|nr:protocadherin-23 isoform X2 [Heterocephalus glaber]
MRAGRQQPGAPVPERQPRPCGPGSPRGRPLLGLLVHAWLWAASGSSAQVLSLSLSVDEGLPPDTLVGDIRAGLPAPQQEAGGFFLSEDSDDFHVHPDTGVIRTARRLDRERRDHYSFVAATLLGAVVQVEIRVNDVNDHSPRFPRDALQLDVSELSPPGTAFRLPGAQDPDAGLFGTQGYSLLPPPDRHDDPAGPFFQLRYGTPGPPPSALEPLDLVLLRRLDREAAATHELHVEAWDGGSPRRTGRLLVRLRVLDENDNPPVFERPEYRAAVREDAPPGAEVCRVRATDRDLGPNGLVRYSLRARPGAGAGGEAPGGAAFFEVEELSGAVRVRRPLDREARAWHQLLVEARDGGAEPEVATVRVSVAVLDVNDNRPAIHLLFLTEGGAARVSEGSGPGDYVARVSVSDADSDPERAEEAPGALGVGPGGGSISLALEGGEGAFALRPGGPPGVFFLCVEGPLDRESRELYELRLVATDTGFPPLSTQETLLLRVSDLNDQPPVFSQEHYRASVSEAAAPGTTVTWVSASDADEPGTDHARLRYALDQSSALCSSEALRPGAECGPAFTIDPESGAISTVRTLDREAQEALELRVVAQDLGEPPLFATCLVSVTVADVNDNEPIFWRQVYNVTLAEHTPVGHCFLQVQASDADAGLYGCVEYSLYDGFQSDEAPPVFQIDPHTGQICVSQDLDRERDPASFDLLVTAKDGGGLSAQAFVRVDLEDVNDNHPVFNPSTYVTSISSQTQPGAEIIKVLATDRDAGVYGTVAYALTPGHLAPAFAIDPTTGIIYLTSSLAHLEPTTLFLTVCARDGGGLVAATNAEVTVHILHTMLAPAEFEKPKYTFSVSEDAPEDTPVGTVKARESLSELVSWLALDREHQMHHQMTVLVTDHGSPPRNATMEVYVTVTDINDNSPFFPQCLPGKEFHIKVLEDQPVNMLVTTVFAKDLDEGNNAEVIYSVSSEDYSDHFKIDANSGEIRTSTILSYNYRRSYRLTVIASDQGQPPLQGQAVLNIQVIPLSKGRGFASQNIRHLVIPENSKPAKILSLMKSPDHLQQHHSAKLHFSIVTEDKNGHFDIDGSTGDLFLSKELDYETASHYLFRLITKDHSQSPALSSTVFLSVDVEDQNDHSPAFQDQVISISVDENVPVGTLLHTFNAKDGDGSFLNSRVQYVIESPHRGTNPFLIHPSFGTLVTAAPLDRESVPAVVLMVTASDQAVNVTDRRSRSQIARVAILDVNDHSPAFVSSPVACVREDATVGSSVHRVHARDPDEGRNGKVTYGIRSGNANAAFMLDESSGLLTIACPLDYEVKTQHILTLVALDDGVPARSSSQTMTVTVLDVNDEAPVFKQHLYEASVKENQSPGEFVTRVGATDRDSGINSKLQFEIISGASFGFFKINADTGEVVTTTTLDREVQGVFTLRVLVRDEGVPSLSCTTTILCIVEDENDHAPEFLGTSPYIEVLENQEPKVVYTVLASDMDAGRNGAVKYHIINGNTDKSFVINETSGELATTRALDREQVRNFTLTVQCSDQGDPPQSSTIQLQVRVLDDNDHSPAFPMLHYQPSVREDAAVGTVVLVLSAVDKDEGLNGQTEYFLVGESSGAFTINPVTGTLRTSRALDREARSLYTFWAVARDCSIEASRSSTVTVTVLVTDVNDNDPVWEQNPVNVFLSSQLPTNQTIAILRASDPDSGPNGTVTFSFADTQSVFSIDEYTGEIKLLQNPSSEHFPAWLWLKVTDQGVPARTTPGLLVIHMEGEDLKISFSQHLYRGLVTENCEAGTSVVTVNAFVSDAVRDIIKYSVFSGNKDGVFSLDSHSGQLTVKEPEFLDFEVRNDVELIILAESSEHKAYSRVAVSIQDVNDNAPCFEQSIYQASVSEGQGYNAHVIQVTASDPDSGLNGRVEYSIVSGNQGEAFQIDALSGVLTTSALLDHESTKSYSLITQATDKGKPRLSATATVRIQVTDINDNAPAFLPSEAVEVAENSLPGVIVTRVSAHDVDLNPAFIFSFAKDCNPGATFAIDQHTGVVILVKALDFEEVTKYELLVQISDSVHHTEAPLTIQVSDVNDNPPVFSEDFYQVTVPESVPLGYSVLTVSATDLDSNENISYRILSSSEDFSIDPVNGTIFTTSPAILPDKIRTIRFLVEASDGGIPELRALTLVEIQVQDENNYAPEFTVGYYNLTLNEDALVGSTLTTFSTFDRDWTPENTYAEYSIISGNSQNNFHVETTSVHSEYPHKQVGDLVLLHSLDREASASHQLVILASDHGCPPLSSTVIVSIQVLDVDDNPPRFSSLQYHAHVKESAPPGSRITVVSASDCDMGSHAEIFYQVISGNEKEHFYLEERTGVLYLIKPLDYEETTKFTLTVQASDGDKKHFSFAVVFISLLDDNDHKPQFMSSSLTCAVPENLPAFSSICSVHAVDFDAGPYGELTYSVLSPCLAAHERPSPQDLFSIDPLTGDIRAKQSLDYESADKYCLVVQARDKGGSTASSTAWVYIEGTDEFEPVFTQDQYFFSLPEKTQERQLIGRVEASDADAGADGVIFYSLATPSPFFSVNRTNGNIYWLKAPPPFIRSQVSEDDTFEMKIIAQSPKPGSRSTSCTVFVNASLSSGGRLAVPSASSFSISLTVSFVVVLLLIYGLTVLVVKHKPKAAPHNYGRKKASPPLEVSVKPTGDPGGCAALQNKGDSREEAPPEWLSSISITEKDPAGQHWLSGSSSHCSVEGETAEDREIQRINANLYRKDSDSALGDRASHVPDSGVPRDSDQLSCLSGETDVMVSAKVADGGHAVEGGDGGEGCDPACVPNDAPPQALQKKGAKEGVLADPEKVESVRVSGDQEASGAAFPTELTCSHEVRGSYAWDYLLSWEPKFQPLALVFNDIAKLKDEHLPKPGIPKERQSLVFPPPLITAVAQPGIKAVPPRMQATAPGQLLQKYPRSPLLYPQGCPAEAMTPSFSPALSLLTVQTPARSPLLSSGELLGTRGSDPHCALKAEDDIEI